MTDARRRPALAARMLALGLSTAAALGIEAGIALHAETAEPVTTPAPAPPPRVVVVRRQVAAGAKRAATPTTKRVVRRVVVRKAAKAATTTRGS